MIFPHRQCQVAENDMEVPETSGVITRRARRVLDMNFPTCLEDNGPALLKLVPTGGIHVLILSDRK